MSVRWRFSSYESNIRQLWVRLGSGLFICYLPKGSFGWFLCSFIHNLLLAAFTHAPYLLVSAGQSTSLPPPPASEQGYLLLSHLFGKPGPHRRLALPKRRGNLRGHSPSPAVRLGGYTASRIPLVRSANGNGNGILFLFISVKPNLPTSVSSVKC